MTYEVGTATVRGNRPINADAFGVYPEEGLFLVVDAMGSEVLSAEVARVALETLYDAIRSAPRPPAGVSLRSRSQHAELVWMAAAHEANQKVQRTNGGKKVGTTFAGILDLGGAVSVAHLGDSRVYRFRGDLAEPWTVDHTQAGLAVRLGEAPEVAAAKPGAGLLTAALGLWEAQTVKPELHVWTPDDVLLLCTDGLSDQVSTARMARVLRDAGDLQAAASRLITLATEAGGNDDTTCVLVRQKGGT